MNKLTTVYFLLLLSPLINAKQITMEVHKVPLVDVLYELAEAAQVNLVVTQGLGFEVSLLLQNVDAKSGLVLVCTSVNLDCEYSQQGLVVSLASEGPKTEVLPLHQVKLKYAEADTILIALKSAQSMLSPRGQLLADNRSQQIFVYDDEAHTATLIEAIKHLDQPLEQMLIEGRIVIVKSSLGQSNSLDFIGKIGAKRILGATNKTPLGVSFNPLGGSLQLGLVGTHVMLNLELAGLEARGLVLTLAQPQILVQEGYAGSIQTGQEVPYLVATDNGPQQEWKRAVLGLTVTSRVLPMDQVQLDLVVVQDSIGDLLPNGQLALNTHTLQTRAVVGFGQTLVIGGALYQQQLDRLLVSPALSGLPFVGQWFKQHKQGTERLELLVFVTPRIVNP
mgnify:FL=1